MSVVCNCSTGGGNTGTPSCYGIFDVTVQAILVEYYKPDGSINGIEISGLTGGSILDQAFWDARTKDINPRTRFYPTPALKNITDERADDITEEFEDTSSVFIQEGARAFTGLIIKGDPVMVAALQSWRCSTTGVFFIDKSGNLIGDKSRAGFLDPILLQDDSFSVSLVKGTDTTKQKVSIKFIISSLMEDANLGMIEATSITAALKGSRGLVDVIAGTPTNVSTAGFDVQLNTPYGGVTTPIPAEGLELADFAANEISPTPGVEAIASVTESATIPGFYSFVWAAAVGSGDVHQISNPAVGPLDKNFDLNAFNVTTP